MIDEVWVSGILRAMIVRRNFHDSRGRFFTPSDFSQQVGYFSHRAGHTVAPHRHLAVQGPSQPTQEVLIIRTGRLRVDFYGEGRLCAESRILEAGDIILLVSGGHGFQVLDDCEMIEIKPGPYIEGADRVRFAPLTDSGDDDR